MKSKSFEFEVVGAPTGKPAWMAGGKGHAAKRRRRYEVWRAQIRRGAMDALRGGHARPVFAAGVPLALEVTYWIARPAGHVRASGELKSSARPMPAVKPDLANLTKGLEDSLDGVTYHGDQQIVDHVARKRYCPPGREPGASVRLVVVEDDSMS